MKKYLIFIALCFCSVSYGYVYDVEFIDPHKRYCLEKQIYDREMERKGYPHYKEFPDYWTWVRNAEERAARFYEWLKSFSLYLSGDLDCPTSYMVWALQNPNPQVK